MFTTLDPLKRGNPVTLSPDLLTANIPNKPYSVLSTLSKTTGKFYVEITVIGVGSASGGASCVGIGNINTPTDSQSYDSTNVRAYGGFVNHDVIGLLIDLTYGVLTFYKNGSLYGVPFTDINLLGPVFILLTNTGGDSRTSSTMTVNFGRSVFNFAIPPGFTAWDTTAKLFPLPTTSLFLPTSIENSL